MMPATVDKPGLDFQRVQTSIQMRFNPVRLADATRLGTELDAFYLGYLTIARFWEAMLARDADLRTSFRKIGDAVEQLEYQIVKTENASGIDDSLAEKQVEVLQSFYKSISVTDVYKQDQLGGVGLLARQLLDARAYGWSVHEITWKPEPGGLSAEFRRCPLYWFENRTGKLRFLLNDFDVWGVEMKPNEWLVACSDNFMESATSLWLYKKELLQAWVRFCSKFGMPLPVIKTDASKGSEDWNNAVEAAGSISEDWALVVNTAASLEFANVDRSGDSTFQVLYEDLKRTLVTLVMGSDLSTISAGSGSGQGASLQGRDDTKREKADCSFISETLQRHIDKFVLEYNFGEGVPILARFVLVPSKQVDFNAEIAADTFLTAQGVRLSKNDLLERYGRKEAETEEDSTTPQQGDAQQQPEDGMANSLQLSNELVSEAQKELARARAHDLQSAARELSHILRIDDVPTMLKSLKHFISNSEDRAKHLLNNPSRMAKAIENLLATAFLQGTTSAPKV